MRTPISALVSICMAIATLALTCEPALAATPYKYEAALSERLSSTLREAVPGGAFASPHSLAFDASGNLYVADPKGHLLEGIVEKFDLSNTFQAQLGLGVLSGNAAFGVAVNDETGHVYVGDSNFSEVFALNATGEGLSQWTGASTPAGTFGGGCCFIYDAVDNSTSAAKGEIYVMTTHEGGEVDVFESQGEDKEEGKYLRSLKTLEGFAFGTDGGLAVNNSSGAEAGEVYVVDSGHGVVDRFSAEGVLEEAHQLKGPSPTQLFKEPVAVAVDDATGDVFIVDREARAVDKFSPSGELLAQIKEAAGEAFVEPIGVAVQRSGPNKGDVYVSDAGKKAIDVFGLEEAASPTIDGEGVTQLSGDSASLGAEVNPHGATTTYRFEYGVCATPEACALSSYEHSVPIPEGTIGSEEDFSVLSVAPVHVQGLTPGTSYHFRTLAQNSHGQATGEERTFTTQGGGGELVLPDGREWELVSPPDKHGGTLSGISEVGVVEAAAGGGAVSYRANAPTEDEPQGYAGGVQVLSRRSEAGWGSHDIATPNEAATGNSPGTAPEYRFFSEDLESAAIQPFGRFNPALSSVASEQTPYLRALGSCESSCYRPLVSAAPGHENVPAGTRFGEELLCEEENGVIPNAATVCGPLFVGASKDLGHVVISAAAELSPGAGREQLYEWSGGSLQLISVLAPNEAGEELPVPAGAASFGSSGFVSRAISADGTRVFWEAQSTLYMRDSVLHKTLQLDAGEATCVEEGKCESGAGSFRSASADGSRVYFTDTRRLTKDAGAGTVAADLYECRISRDGGGKPSCALSDLTPIDGGESANVQGDVLGASEDGATLYFVAEGTLGTGPNAKGESAIAGQPNLYVRHDGVTSFIATLSGGDRTDWQERPQEQPTKVSPSGQWLAFMSEQPLTGYDNHDAVSGKLDAEVFLYEQSSGQITCASCDPTGARPVGLEYDQLSSEKTRTLATIRGEWVVSGWVAALVPQATSINNTESLYQGRYLSDSGRLFVNVLGALVPQDVNGVGDVYEHEPLGVGDCTSTSSGFDPQSGGCIALISSGSASRQSEFLDASESGNDVFFLTTAKLSPLDVDAAEDVYDAHACTSASPCIPAPPVAPPPCATEASCKASPTPQPQIFGAPSSATFSGPGNPVSSQSVSPKVVVKALTRSQKLSKALRICKKHKSKKTRSTCEKKARRTYGRSK